MQRILTPAAKFWVCKRAVALAGEAMEVLGGNGYVEDAPLARLVYILVGLSALWQLIPLFRSGSHGEVHAQSGHTRR